MSNSTTPTGPTKAEQFMNSPLVAWLKTIDQTVPIETVHDLSNGVLLNKVMYTVDPNAYSMSKVNRSVTLDLALCLQNFQLLVQRIKHFYLTSVQQLVICNLPNISSICYDPESDFSLDQLEKLLTLLLGCAIQCESKGPIIEKMKSMDLSQQQSLVLHIQQVTDSTDYVCSIDWNDLEEISKQSLEGLCRHAYIHLQRVAKERDHHYDHITEILLERDYYKSLHDSQSSELPVHHVNGLPVSSPIRSPSVNPEMIELKKKCRALQEKLDGRAETLSDAREEGDKLRLAVKQLHQEKRELAEDAKSVRVYRDEVEALRVQSAKVEKLEIEVIKYRQKAEDTDYLKKRISDLQGQNDLMSQTKKLLEQKATSLSAKTEGMDELQEAVVSYKVRAEALEEEKEMDSQRIEELLASNTRLEIDNRQYQEKCALLTSELESLQESSAYSIGAPGESSLSFELSEADLASKAKVVRLEKEAHEMEKTMDALRHAQAKGAELEKTTKKLHAQTHSDRKDIIKLKEENEVLKVKASRVDKLQVELSTQRERLDEANRIAPKLKNIKARNENLLEAKAKLEDEVEALQAKVALMSHIQDENASLKVQLDSHSSEHEEDQRRLQELLEQNAQLELEKKKVFEESEAQRAQLLQLQTRSSLSAHKTILSPPRVSEAEIASRAKLQRLEKETRELEKSIEALRHYQAKCGELEKMNKKLQSQAHTDRREVIRLKEEVQGSRSKVTRLEKQQSEMKSQEERLEDIDGASTRKMMELRQQNALLSETKVLLEEELTGLHAKLEQLGDIQADNAALNVRVDSLADEINEEGLRMQELLQQNAQLEMSEDSKSVEIETLKSHVAQLKLKLSNEDTDSYGQTQPSGVDIESQTKLLRLERQNRELDRSLQVLKQSSERVNAEVEKTNKKLTAQIHADNKEIARLKEELRKERNQHARLSRLSSVGDEHDLQETRQLQELESKFKDFYSQSLSNKDDRIKVLDSRIEELTGENHQQKQEIKDLRMSIDRLKEVGSPRNVSRTHSPREMNRLKEQAADALRLRDKFHALQEENNHLTRDFLEAKHVIQQQDSHNQRLDDRIQMLEQLNQTLEEEKKTLLQQVNKMLEKNQELLVKTLESKDQAFEEERMLADRLGELERDKARLTERLIAHQKEQISKEMDHWKKSKSKSILKKGFKKLKGKIQGRSHVFEVPEPGALGSSNTVNSGSMGSPSGSSGVLGGAPYALDGNMSQSSQSISSSNSGKHSEDMEEIEQLETSSYVPRAPTLDGSPFMRPRKARSYTLPGIGAVKMRHAQAGALSSLEPERSDNNLITLEDFLAESEKTPNKRRVMELKRASLIGTPPSTPRNSMLLPAPPPSNSSQIFDLSEFLSKFDPGDASGMIPENEELQQLSAAKEFRTSQQSVSQRSKSSSSLQSAPSQTSLSSKNDGIPVIVNPAANSNFNNNNNPPVPSIFFSEIGTQLSGPSSSTPNSESNPFQDISQISSQSYTDNFRPRHTSVDGRLSLTEALAFLEPLNDVDEAREEKTATVSGSHMSRSKSNDALKKDSKQTKSRGLFKRNIHRSTEGLVDEQKSKVNGGKPPIGKPAKSGQKNIRRQSTSSLEAKYVNEKRRSTPNLSALTDINQPRDSSQADQASRPSKRKLYDNVQFENDSDPFSKIDGSVSSLSQPASASSKIPEEESVWQEYGPF